MASLSSLRSKSEYRDERDPSRLTTNTGQYFFSSARLSNLAGSKVAVTTGTLPAGSPCAPEHVDLVQDVAQIAHSQPPLSVFRLAKMLAGVDGDDSDCRQDAHDDEQLDEEASAAGV